MQAFFIGGDAELDQNLTLTIRAHRAHHTIFFHLVDDSGSTVITEAKLTL